MRSALRVVCILGMLLASVTADSCVGTPNTLAKGANCGGSINCAYGLYCDKSGVCSDRVLAGQTCGPSILCVETATCKGPTGTLTCVANANPGEPCSTNAADSVPMCGTPSSCLNAVCGGGQHGDSCLQNSDCFIQNVTCSTSNLCTAMVDGSFCVTAGQCMPGSSCVGNVCTKQITTGDCTVSSNLCGYGSTCVYNPTANTTMCLSTSTLNIGDYCGSSGNGYLCKDAQRCVNNLCAPGRVGPCSTNGYCSFDETCSCGGLYLYSPDGFTGQGQCQKSSCLDQWGKYTNCAYTKCRSENMGRTNFAKSCMQVNCATETTNYRTCSGSSTLGVSFLFVAFLALFSSFSKF